MSKSGQSAPCPAEYLELILLPRQGVCAAPRWRDLSRLEQHILLLMLEQEADPIYRHSGRED